MQSDHTAEGRGNGLDDATTVVLLWVGAIMNHFGKPMLRRHTHVWRRSECGGATWCSTVTRARPQRRLSSWDWWIWLPDSF